MFLLDWFFNLTARRNYLIQEIARLRGEKLHLQGMNDLKDRLIRKLAEKYPEVRMELDELKLPPKKKVLVDTTA